MIGTKIDVTIYCDDTGAFGGVTSIVQTPFTHQAGFTTTSNVKKIDDKTSAADSYVVTTNWAEDDASKPIFQQSATPPTSPPFTPVTTIVADAISKINATFPGTFE